MKLGIFERLNLLALLPTQHDYLTIKKLNQLRERLDFTEDEIKDYEIKLVPIEGGSARYEINEAGKTYKADIVIGEICEKEIVSILKKKNDDRMLESYEVSLYDKFVEKNFGDQVDNEVENVEVTPEQTNGEEA